MRALIIGCGHIGQGLANLWRQEGHFVQGTTTTPGKVERLQNVLDQVTLCKGGDEKILAPLLPEFDLVVIAAAPSVRQAKTPAEREASYREALLDTCQVAARHQARCIFLSSFAVYGDGLQANGSIQEDSPLTESTDPSPRYFRLAEEEVLKHPQGSVLRLPDIYGAPGDMSYPDRLKLGLTLMGGQVPFSGDAPLYRIHYLDVVSAVDHVVKQGLRGVFNVCDPGEVPPTNRRVFDRLSEAMKLDKLTFLGQIKAPLGKVSADKIYRTGYRITEEPHVDL